MKKFSFYFVILLFGSFSVFIKAQAQWEPTVAPGLSLSLNPFIVFSPVDYNICWGVEWYAVGYGGTNPKLVLTTDGGNNWSVSPAQIPSGSGVEAIYARDSQTAWMAVYNPGNGANSGIYKTTDSGNSWQKQGNAFTGTHPTLIYFYNKSDTGICIGTPSGSRFEVYTTIDGGAAWVPVQAANMPAADPGDLFATDGSGKDNTFIFGTYLRRIYRSTDRGITWTRSVYSPAQGGIGIAVQLEDSQHGLASTYFGELVNQAAKTTDGGSSWTPISPNPPVQPSLYYLSYVPGTAGWYVATSHNNITLPEPTTPGSSYTLDGGDTWNPIDTKPHGPISFSDDGWGWSGGIGDTIYKIFRDILPVELLSFTSSVTGNNIQLSWQTATEINNKGFEVYRNGNKIAFVDGNGTTTEKQDYSFTDKALQSGIYNYRLNQIDFDGRQRVVGELTVSLELPGNYSIEQNYPNPFNPSTKIKYSIPVSGFVTLKVFDELGKEVAALVNEVKPAGTYEAEFNAANLSSGIYYYRMQSQNKMFVKKMILLR